MKKSEMLAELIWLFNWELKRYIRTLEADNEYSIVSLDRSRLLGVLECIKAVRIIDDIERADFIFNAILHKDIETLKTLEIPLEK